MKTKIEIKNRNNKFEIRTENVKTQEYIKWCEKNNKMEDTKTSFLQFYSKHNEEVKKIWQDYIDGKIELKDVIIFNKEEVEVEVDEHDDENENEIEFTKEDAEKFKKFLKAYDEFLCKDGKGIMDDIGEMSDKFWVTNMNQMSNNFINELMRIHKLLRVGFNVSKDLYKMLDLDKKERK